jgi:hypothetical protein
MSATQMKQLIKRLLLPDIPVREYATVTVDKSVAEHVYLEQDGMRTDVSARQWLLCLKPVTFGVWMPGPVEPRSTFALHFDDSICNGKTVAQLTLELTGQIQESDGTLLLLKLKRAATHHLNFISTQLLYRRHYKKPEQNLEILRSYAAAYSYPRKVRLVSFREGNYQNIFPMDLVGDIPQSRHYVFGLRHTNVTLERIIHARKICVSEVPFEYKDAIYELGKHHRNQPAQHTPINFLRSDKFHFPVPDWAVSYKEIEIEKTINLGSHMLLWGREINEKLLANDCAHLFHVHFLHYLHQKKRGLEYRLV